MSARFDYICLHYISWNFTVKCFRIQGFRKLSKRENLSTLEIVIFSWCSVNLLQKVKIAKFISERNNGVATYHIIEKIKLIFIPVALKFYSNPNSILFYYQMLLDDIYWNSFYDEHLPIHHCSLLKLSQVSAACHVKEEKLFKKWIVSRCVTSMRK